MRIFLGSSAQKCERMRESPFENQTKLHQKKVLIEKNFKMNHSLNLHEDFRDQYGTAALGFQSTRILVGWSGVGSIPGRQNKKLQ